MKFESEFLKIVSARFTKAFERIVHGVEQLSDEQIWYRASNNSNSIGIIWQHLEGNLNQWVGEAVGGMEYHRNRPQEFKESEHISKTDILKRIDQMRKKIDNIISNFSAESLLSPRRVQGYDETVMSALLKAVIHLEMHSGQILFIAKLVLGEKYKESWIPANPEQASKG